ncbi:putative bifunctional diguanylate cyclase/phosphodiesterase [Planococcus versutus]|uniref:Diguanylate cyclase n=1 Tax=Planococcus versutus TaxID=1302659 RepID=A0A1B1S0N4_9BACL|nr:EAL domain-containing protein [Planococcus versutus]ANU26753.1 diguanylate cyclase [Planococcus versutus]
MDIFSTTFTFSFTLLAILFLALLLGIALFFIYYRYCQKLKLSIRSAESEQKFQSVFDSTSDAVVVANQQGTILQWNSGAEIIFNYSKGEALGANIEIIVPDSLLKDHRTRFQHYLETGVSDSNGKRVELVGRRKDASELPIEVSLSTWRTEKDIYFSSIIRDISERKETEKKVNHLVYRDTLTGLPNRRLFNDQLFLTLEQLRESDQQLSLLSIDLDHFKLINDTYGHCTGDQILVEVANRLQSIAQTEDIVSRISADEYVLLLPNTDAINATIHAKKVLELFEQPFQLQQEKLFVTPSIGISVYPSDGVDLDSLTKNADIALYEAKNKGKNNYQFFTEEMNQLILRKSKLATDMRKGLEHNEFFVHYQPQMDISTEKIVGVEALVRWVHPELGPVSPAEFIPIAEDTGSIVFIGEFVLRQACLQNKAWQTAGLPHFRVAVNISSHQFSQCNLTETVCAALSAAELDAKYLELELTESIIQSSPLAVTTMQKLKLMGIHLSIDDFGTGYSSLRYLKLFPVNTLKIDQCFIRNVINDPKDAALVDTIVKMAENLELNVIAEGVETAEQFQFLKQKNCNQAQGYYFNRPLPPEEIERLYHPTSHLQTHA